MDNLYETKQCRLTVKAPIHIGSVEQRYTPFDYIYHEPYVYPVSEERLSRLLLKEGLIDAYTSAISREGHRFRLKDFLPQNKINLNKDVLAGLSGNRRTLVKGDIQSLQDYKPFIRDGMGDIFIPGTSLKGVFRTAVLYNSLKEFKDNNAAKFKEIVEQRLETDIDKRVNKKKFFQWGMERWLESFVLEDKKKDDDKIKTRCPNTDWFRMFHVTDAYPAAPVETMLIPVNILKKETAGWKYKTENSGMPTIIWVECIPEGAVFEFNISWDKKLFEEFKKRGNKINSLPKNLDEILAAVDRWLLDVHDFEKKFCDKPDLQNWYNNNSPNFRIGFGSGMTSTTIAILLDEQLRKKVRNYAGLDRKKQPAPKSRRVWLKDDTAVPLGWATI